jgi:hypothetical protein
MKLGFTFSFLARWIMVLDASLCAIALAHHKIRYRRTLARTIITAAIYLHGQALGLTDVCFNSMFSLSSLG